MWTFMFIFINLASLIQCRIECSWNKEYLCGDQCLPFDNSCECGQDTLSYSTAKEYNCCHQGTCTKNSTGVICLNGNSQVKSKLCNNQCIQDAEYGISYFMCEDHSKCISEVEVCQGKPLCKDSSDLALCQSQEAINCTRNWGYQSCGTLSGAKFQNYGCKDVLNENVYFGCTNRKDKVENGLFQKALALNTTDRIRGVNYNEELHFDNFYIFCGNEGHNFSQLSNISIKEFKALKDANPSQNCSLKNGKKVYLHQLWSDLIMDYSFQLSNKMTLFYRTERLDQLNSICTSDTLPRHCTLDKDECIYSNQWCDGIANCRNGEDEDFEECKDYFSPLASITCQKKDIYNVNITIRAVMCNNITECENGEDEEGCFLEENVSTSFLMSLIPICSLITLTMWKLTVRNLKPVRLGSIHLKNLGMKHQSKELKTYMHQIQHSRYSKSINQGFIKMELKWHNGLTNETICCIKNHLDSSTVARIMKDLPSASETSVFKKLLKAPQSIVSKLPKNVVNRILKLKMPKTAIAHMMDLTKDSLFLFEVVKSQGGFFYMMAQTLPYIKGIWFCLLGSIVVPLTLSSLRLLSYGPAVLYGTNDWFTWTLFMFTIPFFPVMLIVREAILVEASKSYKISLKILRNTKYYVAQFIQTDLGLESHLQSVISIILLLLSVSQTKTISGLDQLIVNEQIFYLPTNVALVISIIWSLYSCIHAHLKGVAKKRDYSTTKSFLATLVFASSSIAIRIFSYVLFLTPCLGLFNCLRHLQGEMYPYYNPYFSYVDVNDDSFHFGNASTLRWSKITRWTYVKPAQVEPPQLTLYTILSISQHLYLLLAMVLLNIVFLLFLKRLTNPDVFKTFSLIDNVVHAVCNCFIPHPMEEWDEGKGSVSDHKSRKAKVLEEMLASILLNFAFNLMLLTPMIFLGINAFERHDILVDSIGVYPEEIQAYDQIKLMIILGYTALLILTLIQVLSYYLYNGRFHPFAIIVQPKPVFIKKLEDLLDSDIDC